MQRACLVHASGPALPALPCPVLCPLPTPYALPCTHREDCLDALVLSAVQRRVSHIVSALQQAGLALVQEADEVLPLLSWLQGGGQQGQQGQGQQSTRLSRPRHLGTRCLPAHNQGKAEWNHLTACSQAAATRITHRLLRRPVHDGGAVAIAHVQAGASGVQQGAQRSHVTNLRQ